MVVYWSCLWCSIGKCSGFNDLAFKGAVSRNSTKLGKLQNARSIKRNIENNRLKLERKVKTETTDVTDGQN